MKAIVKWRVYPALRAAIGVSLGIIIGSLSGIRPSFSEMLLILVCLGYIMFFRVKGSGVVLYAGTSTCVLLLCLGLFIEGRQTTGNEKYQIHSDEIIHLAGTVAETGPVIDDGCRIILNIHFQKRPKNIVNRHHFAVWWNTRDNCDLLPGDTVLIEGRLIPIELRGDHGEGFNRYLIGRGVAGRVFPRTVKTIPNKGGLELQDQLAYKVRKAWVEMIQRRVPGENGHFLVSLCLGYRSISQLTKKEFQHSGAMHVLAISGLHVGIAAGMIRWPLSRIIPNSKVGNLLIRLISQVFLWGFVGISGSSEPSIRAAVMITVWDWGRHLNRKAHWLQLLSISLLIQEFIDPDVIFQAGFQLSYTAVASILWLSPWIQLAVRWTPRYLQWISGLLLVSIAAQAGVVGWTLYNFEQFPALFLLTNLVAIPMATLLLAGGWLLILSDHFCQLIAEHLSTLLGWLTSTFLGMISIIAEWSPRSFRYLQIDLPGLFMYYSGFLLVITWLYTRKKTAMIAGTLLILIFMINVKIIRSMRITAPAFTYWTERSRQNLVVQQSGTAFHFQTGMELSKRGSWSSRQLEYHIVDSLIEIRTGIHQLTISPEQSLIVALEPGDPQVFADHSKMVLFDLSNFTEPWPSEWQCRCHSIYIPATSYQRAKSLILKCKNKPEIKIISDQIHHCLNLNNPML